MSSNNFNNRPNNSRKPGKPSRAKDQNDFQVTGESRNDQRRPYKGNKPRQNGNGQSQMGDMDTASHQFTRERSRKQGKSSAAAAAYNEADRSLSEPRFERRRPKANNHNFRNADISDKGVPKQMLHDRVKIGDKETNHVSESAKSELVLQQMPESIQMRFTTEYRAIIALKRGISGTLFNILASHVPRYFEQQLITPTEAEYIAVLERATPVFIAMQIFNTLDDREKVLAQPLHDMFKKHAHVKVPALLNKLIVHYGDVQTPAGRIALLNGHSACSGLIWNGDPNMYTDEQLSSYVIRDRCAGIIYEGPELVLHDGVHIWNGKDNAFTRQWIVNRLNIDRGDDLVLQAAMLANLEIDNNSMDILGFTSLVQAGNAVTIQDVAVRAGEVLAEYNEIASRVTRFVDLEVSNSGTGAQLYADDLPHGCYQSIILAEDDINYGRVLDLCRFSARSGGVSGNSSCSSQLRTRMIVESSVNQRQFHNQ